MKVKIHSTLDNINSIQGGVVKIVKAGAETSLAHLPRRDAPQLRAAARKNQKMSQAGEKWNSLTDSQKNDWKSAAAAVGLSAPALFLQRIAIESKLVAFQFGASKFGADKLGGTITETFTTENELANYKCTHFCFLKNNGGVKILQRHLEQYEVLRKVGAKNNTWGAVEISEDPTPPITLAVSYRFLPKIASDSFGFFLRFYKIDNLESPVFEIGEQLPIASAWTRYETTIAETLPDFDFYALEIEQGTSASDLFIDNLEIKYYNINWAQDPECNFATKKIKNGWRSLIPIWESSAPYTDYEIKTEIV